MQQADNKNIVTLPSHKINDATIQGNMNSPEAERLLVQEVVLGFTASAPRVSGDRWAQGKTTWGEALRRYLTRHPESKNKGGDAFFLAESALTGKRANAIPLCYKLKDKIQTAYAAAIDVDGGCTVEAVLERIRRMGIFAVIYTTYSHTSKGGPGSDRFRVILPLAVPFDLGEGDDRRRRAAEWEALYVGLCTKLIPDGGRWDFSAARPSQLMYAPARPKGAAFKHHVIAGAGLDLSTVPAGDTSSFRRRGPSGLARGAAHDGEPAFLSYCFDLMAWHADNGQDFLLESFFELIGWEVGGAAGAGFEILCPNAVDFHPEVTRVFHRELTRLKVMFCGLCWGQYMRGLPFRFGYR